MAYENPVKRRRHSVIRRVWLYGVLLALPAVGLLILLFILRQITPFATILATSALLVYFLLLMAAMIDSFVRPLQTLANVISSLREGDYSFRARGAGTQDALGELGTEVNALANLLQKQRVNSLEATALLARILEVMHAPLFAFDKNSHLRLINNAGLKFLDLPSARCLGRTAQELQLEQLLAATDLSIHSFKSPHGSSATSTRWLLRKAFFRQEGAPHILLLLSDVSLPLQEEEQRSWKRLIRVLGHELSNSLTPIKSIANSLLSRLDSLNADEATLRDFTRGLSVIESRADSLHRFVQSYRQLAQLPPPQFKSVQLAPLLERVAHLEQRLAVELDPGPSIELNADQDQLEQMMINLLANAVDASLENGEQVARISWQSIDAASVLVQIEDRGLGIANAENLFVPFYTTKSTGSGVGLALAQQIARAHGGEIVLMNREEGQGVCTSITLPTVDKR